MNKEEKNRETMDKNKSEKTIKKKKGVKKVLTTPKSEATPSLQVTIKKFEDLEGKFLLVKVGNNDRPATDDDIEDIEEKLIALLDENDVNCLAFVTHHAVEFEIVEKLTRG